MRAPGVRARRKRQAWLFNAPRRLAADGERWDNGQATAEDGRLVVDEGHAENADRLLERLREVHGEPRADLAGGGGLIRTRSPI